MLEKELSFADLPISLSLAIISSGILAAVMKSLNLFAAASDEFIISRVTSVLILLLVMMFILMIFLF